MKITSKKISTSRKTLYGNKRSHALNATKRKFKLNLKKARVLVDGVLRKAYLTVKEIRTMRKTNQK